MRVLMEPPGDEDAKKKVQTKGKKKKFAREEEEASNEPPTYEDTKQIFDKWERIRNKYWPESDLYNKNNNFDDTCALFFLEEFDKQEKLEERKKFNFYTNR